MMGIIIDHVELLALKKIVVICGALAERLNSEGAAIEQRALTRVLANVIERAESDNARRAADPDGLLVSDTPIRWEPIKK